MADNEAKIVLSAQDKTKQAFDQVKGSFKALGERAEGANASFSKLGAVLGAAFSVGTFTEFVKSTAEGLAKLKDLKDATGSSISNLSALEDVALRTGNSFETVSDALLKLNKGLTAAKPDSDLAAVLKGLGLSVKELKAQDPAEALLKIAQAMDQFADDGEKARAAQVLFGKSLSEVAPFLKDLAEKTKLVGTVTEKAVDEAKKFSDTLSEAHKNSIDLARTLVGPLLESLNATIKLLKEGKEQGRNFYETLFREQLKLLGLNPDETLDQVNERVAALNKLLADGTLTVDRRTRLENQLNGLLKQRGKLQEGDSKAGAGRGFVNPEEAKPPLKIGDPEAEKAFDDFMRKLKERATAEKQQIDLGREQTEAEKYRVQVLSELSDTHSKLDAGQKKTLTSEALRVAGLIKYREEQEKATKAMLENSQSAQQSIAAILREGDARKQANAALSDQFAEIGLSNDKLEDMRIARLEVAKATEEMALATARANEATDAELSAMQRNIDLLQQQIDLRRAAKDATDKESNDPNRGAARAVEAYIDTAKKAGDATEALGRKVGQDLEDGLTAGLTGGKFEIKNFVNEILAEIIRLQVVRPLLASIFGASGGGSNWVGLISGLFGGGSGGTVSGNVSPGGSYDGTFAKGGTLGAGHWGIAGEAGAEVVHGPAQITPMGAGGGATIVQNNYIDSRTDASNVAQIAAQAAQQAVRQYHAARVAQGANI